MPYACDLPALVVGHPCVVLVAGVGRLALGVDAQDADDEDAEDQEDDAGRPDVDPCPSRANHLALLKVALHKHCNVKTIVVYFLRSVKKGAHSLISYFRHAYKLEK